MCLDIDLYHTRWCASFVQKLSIKWSQVEVITLVTESKKGLLEEILAEITFYFYFSIYDYN